MGKAPGVTTPHDSTDATEDAVIQKASRHGQYPCPDYSW